MPVIQAGWESYLEEVIPKDAGPVQREECRRAFFAGAKIYHEAVRAIAADEVSEEQAERILQSVVDELAAFPLTLLRA
jgi:transcriptional regulator NrdR family protein